MVHGRRDGGWDGQWMIRRWCGRGTKREVDERYERRGAGRDRGVDVEVELLLIVVYK